MWPKSGQELAKSDLRAARTGPRRPKNSPRAAKRTPRAHQEPPGAPPRWPQQALVDATERPLIERRTCVQNMMHKVENVMLFARVGSGMTVKSKQIENVGRGEMLA